MHIALLIGEVAYISYHKMVQGLMDAANERGDSIFLFTCEGWKYEANTEYEKGEYQIFQLPDFKNFDGAIVDLTTINDVETKNYLMAQLQDSQIPFVSLGIEITGGSCFSFDNNSAISTLIDHLVLEHKAQNIHFIGGTTHNIDAKERLAAYKRSMQRHGLAVEDSFISYGNYEYAGGYAVVDSYLANARPLPDAFVCANDQMAIGALMRLEQAGYRVPEDIILTGYDNLFLSEQTRPRLTTVDRLEAPASERIYEMLCNRIAGKTIEYGQIAGEVIFRESCGCAGNGTAPITSNEMVYHQLSNERNFAFLKGQSIDFSSLDTYEAVLDNLAQHISVIQPDRFYLCLCGNETEYQERLEHFSNGTIEDIYYHKYTDEFTIALAYENGSFVGYKPCSHSTILSASVSAGIHFIVMPVHYRKDCIGFCALGSKNSRYNNAFFQHLVLNLNNALAGVSKKDMMQVMLNHMNSLWVYDELTKLLNRSGFRKEAPLLMANTAAKGCGIGAIFIDLDHLKQINDQLGHEIGDHYILAMADVLRTFDSTDNLLVRFGGDEFVILTACASKVALSDLCRQIEEAAAGYVSPDFVLSASLGFAYNDDPAHVNLDTLLTQADEVMYACKKAKKAAR